MRSPLLALAILLSTLPAAGDEKISFDAESVRRRFAPALQPSVVRYGSTTADMESALTSLCTKRITRQIVPPFLSGVKDIQLQVDCDGFPYLGKPRWAEFVIRDNSMDMVWIMTTKEEEPLIRDLMVAAFGPPTRQNEKYIAFEKARVALRFKPAEVLLYSPNLDKEVRSWFK